MTKLRSLKHKLQPSKRVRLKLPEKVKDAFYYTAEWLALKEEIRRERWPRLMAQYGHCCEDRECSVEHSPGCRIYFDHIQERKDAPHLALEKSNILCRCAVSHQLKTARSRARRYHTPVGG